MQGALLAALLFGGYQASGLCLARLALPGEGPGVRLLVGSVWGSVLLQWLPALLAFAVDVYKRQPLPGKYTTSSAICSTASCI